jgi:outer membrane protein assembly factor BamB
MMVEQFIDRLEQQGLLDKNVIDELRRRVAKVKGKKVTPEAIARYLVDRGHLTRFQATKLVNEITSRPDVVIDPGAKSKLGELRLAPMDDPAGLRDTLEIPAAPGLCEPISIHDEVADLTAIDRDLGPSPPAAGGALAEEPVREPHAEKKSKAPRQTASPAPITPPPAPPPVPLPPEPVVRHAPIAEDLLADLETSGAPASHAADRGKSGWGGGRRTPAAQRKLQKTSEWDSMLLLVGGASLGVLLVIGAFLYMSLTRGAAEELFAAGEAAYSEQSYSQAIRLYDEFLEAYPDHEESSLARVRREMARLRQSYKNPEQGMKVAQEVLPQIEQEESFPQAREELASMLPQIAAGFVNEARLAKDTAAQDALLVKTEAAMTLVNNPEYIPSTLRKSQATTIDSITEDMARVRREIDRVRNLTETIEIIDAAATSGDTPAAYAARQELLNKYPGLDGDEQLLGAMLKISEKERERVKVVEQPLASVTDDPTAIQSPHIVLSHRAGQAIASVIGHVVYTLAGGCVFALDASTGDVLWRRFVGFDTTMSPLPLSTASPGSDVIAVDQRRHDVMRLEAKTGKLLWRLPLGEAFREPVIVEDRIYVATVSGKLCVVDAASGVANRHVQIPQPLEVATGQGVGRPHLYQVAEQDNLYVLSTDTLECREVFYLGHKRGTISVPPVMALGYLFVVENAGPDFSYLHIIATDEQGLHLKIAQQKIRLRGQVLVPPVVGRRQVLVVTDRRAVELYEVDPNNASQTPVLTAGRLNATAEAPMISYPLLEGGYTWVANNRFTKYQLQTTSGKLPSEWVLDEQDVYLAPLQLVRDVVIHVRRRQGAPGFTIAATRINDKDPAWQTEVAVPARGVFVQGDTIDVVTARGRLFQVAAPDFARGVLAEAKATAVRDERLVLSLMEAIDCGDGQWVFSPPQGYNQLVFYRPGSVESALRLLTLTVPLGAATVEPVPFAGGLLVPLQDGNVVLADPVSGGERVHAFHPSVPLGVATQWSRPAVLDGGQEFVIANNHRLLYRVGIKDNEGKVLAELSGHQMEGDVVGPWASVGSVCYGVSRSGSGDVVVAYSLPEATAAQQWPLAGRLLWGPQRVGDVVLLATEKELMCLDGALQQRWKTSLDHGPVIGQALRVDTQVLLTAEDGFIWRIDAASGNIVATVEIGEPVVSGPVVYGDRLLVAGQSGVLFNVVTPSP